MRFLFLMVCCVFLCGRPAYAQCSNGRCPLPTVAPVESWQEHEGDPSRVYLYFDGVEVGGWDYEHGYWRSYDGLRDVWGPPTATPPRHPPLRRTPNYGVDTAKIDAGRLQINGRTATRPEIDEVLRGSIPDDSKKFRLVAAGDEAERSRIVEAWKHVEPALQSRVAVWSVPSDHWSLKDTSNGHTLFVTHGLTFQGPSGQVLHRQADFKGPGDFGAIRKAVKDYDSALDPDLRRPVPPSPPNPINPEPMPPPIPATPANNLPFFGLLASFFSAYVLTKKG